MILQFLGWYFIITLVGLAALPLTLRLFGAFPGGKTAFARPLGILLTGYLFWIGNALGLLRNETGGAWLALLAAAALSLWLGRGLRDRLRAVDWNAALLVEIVFLVGFIAWALVRAYDPAASHTEKPMDLMFMASIWASPTFPPHDAWLSGYPIAYYYGGYWMVMTLGRLIGSPPEIAYTLGQAAWFGLLLSSSFGLIYALLRQVRHAGAQVGRVVATLGGLLAAAMVGLAGNVQAILEWLYAQGVNVTPLANFAQVRGFPESARVTHSWSIDPSWWWWRTSRVLADRSLTGDHREVIAEFPAFSYVLGDNHPHVLAMPFVILVIALALAWFLQREAPAAEGMRAPLLPPDRLLLGVTTLALGSLLWLNTWDFPPYWLLLVAAAFVAAPAGKGERRWGRAAVVGAILLGGGILLFLPYFLTAQSQARGIAANFFNPTRLGQFLWMFLPALLAVCALLIIAWREAAPRRNTLILMIVAAIGLPILFLSAAWVLVMNSTMAERFLAENPVPQTGSANQLAYLLERWIASPWTLLLVAILLAVTVALWWRRVAQLDAERQPPPLATTATTFALMLAVLGLLLVYAPEFIFLRDNFGTRMNTVFKFYYQGWLLLGLAGAYGITHALAHLRAPERSITAVIFAAPALLLVLMGLVFPLAGAWSKTNGFAGTATFDASAWIRNSSPGEWAAAHWLRDLAPPNAVVLEAVGDSYQSDRSRISTLSGRATLLGWIGHERQWRGADYAQMAAGREDAAERIYRFAQPAEIVQLVEEWEIDFVVVGPSERNVYAITPLEEERFASVMDLVLDQDGVRLYATRRGVVGE
jgi:YYY domain-containing protein